MFKNLTTLAAISCAVAAVRPFTNRDFITIKDRPERDWEKRKAKRKNAKKARRRGKK